ncbi:MAG TPA: ABC transporter permease, partial [Acidimicrobiales bacterium]|nr:ABC transporter permease [Acidimicrobiales bacterium]
GIGGLFVAYVLAEVISGHDGYVYRHVPIGYILVGAVYGSTYALGAMGLILVYRAQRFINFSHGAIGSLVGVLAVGMVKVHGLNYWIALPLAVVAGAAVGGLTEIVIIRRFQHSSRIIVTVASIALMGLYGVWELEGSNAEHFTSLTGAFAPPFNVSFTIDVYTFHSAEVLVVIVVPLVLAFLAWFLLKTNAGIGVRAAAENQERALTLGIPVRKLVTIVWVIAGALAVLTYMLSAPFEGVQPSAALTNPTTVLLPILVVAVLARFESLPVAFAAGVGIGIIEALVRWNTAGNPAVLWFIYLIIIVAALLAQSGKMSRAQSSGSSSWSAIGALKPIPRELARLPEVRYSRWIGFAALTAAFVFVPWMWGPSNQLLAGFAVVWAIVGVSLVVLTGWLGQISLGQIGIAGVAGVIAGNLVARYNMDFFTVMAIAAVAGGVVALLVGLPALRIKGLFLAVTTMALAVALDQYFLNDATFPQFIPSTGVSRPLLLQRFDLSSNYAMYLVCLGFLGLAILVARGMRKARAGRALIAINDNEHAASSAAIAATRVKLSGFVVAGMIAGVAGGLDILLLRALNPGSFPAVDSITVFVYAVIGGLGSVPGVLIGIFVFEYLQSITALGSLHLVISSVVALWVLSAFPGGLGQVVYNLRDRLLRMVADRRGLVVPSLLADKRQGGAGPSEQEDLLAAMVAGGNGDGHGVDGTGEEAAVQPVGEAVGAVAGTISLEAKR